MTALDHRPAPAARVHPNVLLVDDDQAFVDRVRPALEAAGYSVSTTPTGAPALEMLTHLRPDVVVANVSVAGTDGFELLRQVRLVPAGQAVPVILLTDSDADILTGLRLGADDCVARTLSPTELVARVSAKTSRPPIPVDLHSRDLRTGLLDEDALLDEADSELARGQRIGRPGALGILRLQERPALEARFGSGVPVQLAEQLADLLRDDPVPLEQLGRSAQGYLLVLLPETDAASVEQRMTLFAERVAATRFTVNGESVRVTPISGWASFASQAVSGEKLDAQSGKQLYDRAHTALLAASHHLDLLPVQWSPDLEPAVSNERRSAKAARTSVLNWLKLPAQILSTFVIGIGLPLAVYVLLGSVGLDISGLAYFCVLGALLITGGAIWIEGFLALDPQQPPPEPGAPYPGATAVIAAYLPNEAATILETVEAFRAIDYPGDLQIIVAYNSPTPMTVEDDLQAVARLDPRVVPLKVEGSTSKAQNVNAAMSHVHGEFVGMFDADHHPEPAAFTRAWRWLSNGYDVVQGHCVIRNGDASLVARTVAVEFEAIYAVSHPGRAALHGFGLFGGSNGYWRTDVLARTRMHGSMLTEDIDSTLRVLSAGAKVASDPGLISRELAPTTVSDLWKQRSRWAQGWFQVSRKHLWRTWRSPNLTLRQKTGMGFLLGWREIYPWLSLQILPVLAYTAYRDGGLGGAVPALLLSTVFTLSVGPAQTLFARRLAVPEVRQHTRWFWSYLLVSSIIYIEWKNTIARVAHIKEILGEHEWNVTPRTTEAKSDATA